jgi:transcriptional regulator with XRE-family HTH domain
MVKHKHLSLATRLKELRRARGWTQQDLSRSSGLTRSYISRLEMGDIALPSSEKLRALSQALGTAPDDLLQAAGYIDNPAQASDLPDLKVYLRRKYSIQDPQILQAIDTIISNLTVSNGSQGSRRGNSSADRPGRQARNSHAAGSEQTSRVSD